MPRAYRVMKIDPGARNSDPDRITPQLGASAMTLGVRIPIPGQKQRGDITPDNAGKVHPGAGGMSVVSSIAGLRQRVKDGYHLPTMIPRRLKEICNIPAAAGPPNLHVFRIGEGGFVEAELDCTSQLRLVPDQNEHGTVQPSAILPLDEYQQAISGTKDLWVSGESDQ